MKKILTMLAIASLITSVAQAGSGEWYPAAQPMIRVNPNQFTNQPTTQPFNMYAAPTSSTSFYPVDISNRLNPSNYTPVSNIPVGAR